MARANRHYKSVQLLAGRIGQEYNIRKKALSGRTVIMQLLLKPVNISGSVLSILI
ncbi:MAG: hypothetical protein PF482_03355 [Desulfobacteraceae bacterium]|nr:hypothetical protein [Desulfobacteraceae bacterium]